LLRHHRRLSFALTGACDIIVVCIMLLLGKQCETITRSFLRHHADFHLRSQALVTSLSSYDIIVVHCGTHADLWLTATFPLLWDLAASFDEAVRDQNLSLFLRHHRRLSLALTGACDFIVILRHHCRSLRHSWRLVANCHLPTTVGSCCFI
jgi:hypothetical protein